MSTKQQYQLSVVVDGVQLGTFDTKTGGDAQAKGNKHRPGGMGPEKSYVSLPSYSDMKLTRVYELARDHELVRLLFGKAGIVRASVTEQPLDANGVPFGNPLVYTGRFLGINPGDDDSTSEAPKMLELSIEVTTVS
jgi:hypothetical protein